MNNGGENLGKKAVFLGLFLANSLINLKSGDQTSKNSQNALNLPNFKNAIEVKSSKQGRVRFYIPMLIGNAEVAKNFLKQVKNLEAIKKSEINLATGTMLIEFDDEKVDAMTLQGAVIKLLGIDVVLTKGRKSVVSQKAKEAKEAVNNGIYEATNGYFDTKSLMAASFLLLAANDIRKTGFTRSPGFATLLWWADHLV